MNLLKRTRCPKRRYRTRKTRTVRIARTVSITFKSILSGQAKEVKDPERRTSDQREMRSNRRKRETFNKERTAHSVTCDREVSTEDVSDIDDFGWSFRLNIVSYTFFLQQFEVNSFTLCSKTHAPGVFSSGLREPLGDSSEQRLLTHPEPSEWYKTPLMLAINSSSYSTALWLPKRNGPIWTLLSGSKS